MAPSRDGYSVKKNFNEITLRVILKIPAKKNYCKQFNDSQEREKHKKGNTTLKTGKNTSKQLHLGE